MRIRIKKDIPNIIHLIKLLINKKNYKKEITNKIHLITYRKFSPHGGVGGGGAVMSANKILFGEELGNIPLKYTFKNENNAQLKENELNILWQSIKFIFENCENETNYAYITHDFACAVGLALLGKKYVLVSHIQGSIVEQKVNFGRKMTMITKLILQYCESFAFKNAQAVYFPSMGAYKYFCSSKYKTVKKDEFKFGGILYNTLYAFPKPEQINNITKNDSYITILSVGQLTIAKGMDKNISFLKELIMNSDEKFRYILVGQGPLKNLICKSLQEFETLFNNFSYIYIESCTYPQMQYLQDISDIYLMLHRISIFDLTTLEMMNKSKCIILSNVGGNPEFNKENNIILVDDNKKAIDSFVKSNIKDLGKKNKKVYDKYFSDKEFKKNYISVIKQLCKIK